MPADTVEVLELLPRVYRVAGKVWARVRPMVSASLDRDDLAQEGHLALLRAAENWDPSRGVPLWAYALPRVRSAMTRLLAARPRTVPLDSIPDPVAPEPEPEETPPPGPRPRAWTVSEIARQKGITPRAVRARLSGGAILGKKTKGGAWKVPTWAVG